MAVRTQILLDPEDHRRAKDRAAELGISLAEYVRRLVAQDLGGERQPSDPSGLFDLGRSDSSDVALEKDRYLAEAVAGGSSRAPRA